MIPCGLVERRLHLQRCPLQLPLICEAGAGQRNEVPSARKRWRSHVQTYGATATACWARRRTLPMIWRMVTKPMNPRLMMMTIVCGVLTTDYWHVGSLLDKRFPKNSSTTITRPGQHVHCVWLTREQLTWVAGWHR